MLFCSSDRQVAIFLSLPKAAKYTFVVRNCLFSILRRHLLVLALFNLSLRVRGAVANLNQYWRVLSMPANLIYPSPLGTGFVADVGISPSKPDWISKLGDVVTEPFGTEALTQIKLALLA
jgi:hypothetical protein